MKSRPARSCVFKESSCERVARRKWLLLAVIALITLPSIKLVNGQGLLYLVNTTSDTVVIGACQNGGAGCSLRGAIGTANSHAGEDGIEFNLPAGSVINLTGALPDIIESVSITGPGADKLTVRHDTGGSYRIFTVTTSGTVTFSGLTISNGEFFSGSGGGIQNASTGTVNVINCMLNRNVAGIGGGIDNSGTANVTNSTISGSEADLGAAIHNSGTLNLISSTLNGNTAFAESAAGGGISNSGIANLTNSTLYENGAVGNSDPGSTGHGGGIINGGTLTVTNCTVSGNSAQNTGGGVESDSGTVKVKSSIIALNNAGFGPDLVGTFSSQGYNLIGKNDGAAASFPAGNPNGINDIVGTSASAVLPKLDPNGLQNNGGPTQTIALLTSSPAIDKGTRSGLTGSLTTDQRGTIFARRIDRFAVANAAGGDGTDIGAFEAGLGKADFNGDGFTDFLLFNSTNRATAIWNLKGNALISSQFGPTLPAGWAVVAVADVDLGGALDYILFNASTRQTAIWFLNNAALVGSSYGPTLPAGWRVIAVFDINGNGRVDYVLFNASSRESAVWFLNGTGIASASFGPTLPSGWQLIDVVDFNADRKGDYLLFNPGSRQTAIWFLNGTTRIGSAFGPTLPAGWTLEGASEFNGNGQPDLLLFEASTRRTAIWFLNGATLAGSAFGPTLPSGYSLVAP